MITCAAAGVVCVWEADLSNLEDSDERRVYTFALRFILWSHCSRSHVCQILAHGWHAHNPWPSHTHTHTAFPLHLFHDTLRCP
jgi:hypothetical protein